MVTYLLLNIIFIGLVLLVLRKHIVVFDKQWWLTLGGLIILTLVFDNIMISMQFFAYAPEKILGLYIYKAPIEDFLYPLLALVLVPALWNYFGAGKGKK